MTQFEKQRVSLWRRAKTLDSGDQAFMSIFMIACCFSLVIALVIPTNWREMLGAAGVPLACLADLVPSIRKLSEQSPDSELIQGYFAALVFVVSAAVVWIWKVDSVSERVAATIERFQFRIEAPFLAYVVVLPSLCLVLWLAWEWPFSIKLGSTPTRLETLLALVLNYRLAMALFGALATFVLGIALWVVTFAFWIPIGHCWQK